MIEVFNREQIEALKAKLDPRNVRERKQSGRALSYIEGWHAIDEANRIFGFGAWTRETLEMRCVSEKSRKIGNPGSDGWGVSYVAKVRVSVNGVVREGYGTGHGIDRDLGLAHESAVKEAETDAMKRALMTFGNPFGLALYDKEQTNVGYEQPSAPIARKPGGDAAPVMSPPALAIANEEPPEGVPVDLWETAVNRARGGVDAYRNFWQHDTTADERALLLPYHESLKALATSKQKAAA